MDERYHCQTVGSSEFLNGGWSRVGKKTRRPTCETSTQVGRGGIPNIQANNIANNPRNHVISEEIMEPEGIHMDDAAAALGVTGRPTTTPIRTSGRIHRPLIKLNVYDCSPK